MIHDYGLSFKPAKKFLKKFDFNVVLMFSSYTKAIKGKEENFMTNILKSQTVKIALGIIIGVGVLALIIYAVQASPASAEEITQNEAKTIALKEAGVNEDEVLSLSIVEGNVNGKKTYDVVFTTEENNYSYDIAKNNGEVVGASFTQAGNNSMIEENITQGENTAPSTDNVAGNGEVSEAKAKEIALNDAGIKDPDYIWAKKDRDDGKVVFDVEFVKDGVEYDYEIEVESGKILSKDYDAEHYSGSGSSTSKALSLEEAKALALKRVSGAGNDHIRIHEDYDDGRTVFEGEIHYNGMEYEFEIDAASGNIIEWKAEVWD